MNKKKKLRKGISLIVLIITIIVMIIIAGAIIISISNTDIIDKAENAVSQTEKQTMIEHIEVAYLSALTNAAGEVNYNILNQELAKLGYDSSTEISELPAILKMGNYEYVIRANGKAKVATEIDKLIITGTAIEGSNKIITDENGDTITIPVKFKIAKDSATQVKDGIVVIAPDGSEFVWIPVKYISTMYGIDKDENKLGKLYDFTIEGITPRNWTETNGVMSWIKTTKGGSNREPDILADDSEGDVSTETDRGLNLLSSIVGIEGTIGKDNEIMLNAWKTQLQNEFSQMIEGVEKNKGFYVGRYETSLKEETNENGEVTKIAQSIGNVRSTSAYEDGSKTWYGLYQVEKEYSEKNNLKDIVGSSMIWGSQYDQMMIWMQKNGIDVTSKEPIKGAEYNETKITGSVEKDKLNNIYDLLGSRFEWTLEANYISRRVLRRRKNDSSLYSSQS